MTTGAPPDLHPHGERKIELDARRPAKRTPAHMDDNTPPRPVSTLTVLCGSHCGHRDGMTGHCDECHAGRCVASNPRVAHTSLIIRLSAIARAGDSLDA